jgi:hypothetical protein
VFISAFEEMEPLMSAEGDKSFWLSGVYKRFSLKSELAFSAASLFSSFLCTCLTSMNDEDFYQCFYA